jgi:hypothetical protein
VRENATKAQRQEGEKNRERLLRALLFYFGLSEIVPGQARNDPSTLRLCVLVAKLRRKIMKEVRKKMIVMRMNESEYKLLEDLHQKSTHKYLSTYARKVLLQKPVILKYRNQTADEFLKEMLLLKQELHYIGHNFNQAVKKLHIVDKIPEFRTWILNNEAVQKSLMKKVDEIKERMDEIYHRLNFTT